MQVSMIYVSVINAIRLVHVIVTEVLIGSDFVYVYIYIYMVCVWA